MTLTIPANDHGAIYVLELPGTPPEGLDEKTEAAMLSVLGPTLVNTDYVDVIAPEAMIAMPLPTLIAQGYDMTLTDKDTAALDTIKGTALLIMSAAFGGQEAIVNLPANTRLVTVLREAATLTAPAPLTSEAAKGVLNQPTKPPKSNARIGGMVATYALIAMFALVGLMIWVGG